MSFNNDINCYDILQLITFVQSWGISCLYESICKGPKQNCSANIPIIRVPLYNVRLQNSISTLTSSNLPTLFRRLTSVNAQSSIYFQCLLLPVNVEGPFHSRYSKLFVLFLIIIKKATKINTFQIQKYFCLYDSK